MHAQDRNKATTGPCSETLRNALLGTLIAGYLVTGVEAAAWSDTYVGYRYGDKFHEPCCSKTDIRKDIFSLTHVSGYQYGINFLTADFLRSDKNDPAKGGGGAQEVYALYRHQLLLSPVSGKSLAFGPIKEVALTAGFDLNSKNDAFAPRVRKFVLGPTLKFDVPGFFDVSLLYRTELNHNGIVGKSVEFDPTYGVSLAWGIPIKSINAKFDGFLNYIGRKGKDGFGFETKAETLARAYLMFDVCNLAGKPQTFYAGVGYEYWNNKFGGNANNDGKTNAPMLALEIHF